MTSMAKIIRIATAALLFAGCGAGCGPRVVPLQIENAWFACTEDRECVVLEDPRCTLVPSIAATRKASRTGCAAIARRK